MIQDSLLKGINALGLSATPELIVKLNDYLLMLAKWNKSFNLTAIRELNEMVVKHLLDSLAIAPYISGEKILDIGSGAGFPGIPLALYFPQKTFYLVDSNRKKTGFLLQVKHELGLANIEVVNQRIEEVELEFCFDVIVTRAFGAINQLIKLASHLCCQKGHFLLMKGEHPTDEINEISGDFQVVGVYPLHIPGLSAQRHLVDIVKKSVENLRPEIDEN